MRTWSVVALVVGAGLLAVCLFASDCGPGPRATDPSTLGSRPLSVEGSSTTSAAPETADSEGASSTSAVSQPGHSQSEIVRLFAELARELAPLPVYGVSELPPQASIPTEWWPALSMVSPSAYDGPVTPNPRVSDSPPGTQEAQVLLKWGDGWLVIVENFRGDLGDVEGILVGEVEGRPANLYELAGGVLVQWSDRGSWYGVFGRDVRPDEVIETALSLAVVATTD